jgi:hypothetical protein
MKVVRNRGSQPIDAGWRGGEKMAAGEFSTSEGGAKVFRNLIVYGDFAVLYALIQAIESRLAGGWTCSREREKETLASRPGAILPFLMLLES